MKRTAKKTAARPARAAAVRPEGAARTTEAAPDEDGGEDVPAVGAALRRMRAARDLSLEQLARASGVSRAMLSQVELGHSTPTIKVLWKIARALGVPFSALLSDEASADETTVLRAARARRLTSHDGRFATRPLFPADRARRVEFYELTLAARGVEEAVPHPPGTFENLVLVRGQLVVAVDGTEHTLGPGDSIYFRADVPHTYRNPGAAEALMYLVMSYAELVSPTPGWSA